MKNKLESHKEGEILIWFLGKEVWIDCVALERAHQKSAQVLHDELLKVIRTKVKPKPLKATVP